MNKMSSMKTIGAVAIIALTGALYAQNTNCKCGKDECKCAGNCSCTSELCKCAGCGESSGWSYAPGEGVSFDETPIVSAEVSLSLDSRYMTYGVIDGKDPIFTPGATATFFDWAYIGVEPIFDVTDGNGKRGGYGKRGFKYTTIDAFVGLAHEFDLGETIGTLGVDVGYMYEYLPRITASGARAKTRPGILFVVFRLPPRSDFPCLKDYWFPVAPFCKVQQTSPSAKI